MVDFIFFKSFWIKYILEEETKVAEVDLIILPIEVAITIAIMIHGILTVVPRIMIHGVTTGNYYDYVVIKLKVYKYICVI